jgi:carbonic anhydrase/acetyltransferase-like protein (isoleucine patch superfamily)
MNGPVILPYRNILPRIDPTAFIAPGVVITGDVEIGAHANIWFNVVIRGDDAPVRIGARANIQDGCVLLSPSTAPSAFPASSATTSRSAIWRCCMAVGWSRAPLSE